MREVICNRGNLSKTFHLKHFGAMCGKPGSGPRWEWIFLLRASQVGFRSESLDGRFYAQLPAKSLLLLRDEGHAVRAHEVRYDRHDGAAGEVELTDIGRKGRRRFGGRHRCGGREGAAQRPDRGGHLVNRVRAEIGDVQDTLTGCCEHRVVDLHSPEQRQDAHGAVADAADRNTSCPSPWSSSRTSPEGVRIISPGR